MTDIKGYQSMKYKQSIKHKQFKTRPNKFFELNQILQSEKTKGTLRHAWKNKKNIVDASNRFEIIANPFKIGILQTFLENEKTILNLITEINDLEWKRLQMDLYEFYQTTHLFNVKSPYLNRFYNYLDNIVMPYLQNITGEELTKVSASCSMYNSGDYLLAHDDLLSDRKIAFVFYLSPWESALEWSESMGGFLELFNPNDVGNPIFPIARSIPPKNNQFIFFKVSDLSFHQVGEVTNFEYPRLTINGWFHGPVVKTSVAKKSIFTNKTFIQPTTQEICLEDWIENYYLEDEFKYNIQKHVEETSEASFENFLKNDIFYEIENELKQSDQLIWKKQGPANKKNYDSLQLLNLEGPIKNVVGFFSSQEMCKLLFEYTQLDLYGSNAVTPTMSIDIQRWSGGSYTILGGSDNEEDSVLDLVLYLNASNQVGVINYLVPDLDQQHQHMADESVLLTLFPKNNVLNLVFRSPDTVKYTKYVSKNCNINGPYVYLIVCSYKE